MIFRLVTVAGLALSTVLGVFGKPQAVEGGQVERTKEPTMREPTISVAGVVLTSAGAPVKSATVVLRAKLGGTFYCGGVRHNRDVLARTSTDSSGKFAFESIGIPPRMTDQIDSLRRGAGGAELVAWSDGTALQWTELKGFKTPQPVTIKLSVEAHVTGQIGDKGGKPVEGGRLRVYGITKSTSEMEGFFRQPGDLNLMLSEIDQGAQTDHDGRFTMHHLPADYRVSVGCEAPNMTRQVIAIDTSNGSDLQQMKRREGSRDVITVVRSPIQLTMAPGKDVVVKVFDEKGKPVVDGAITASAPDRTSAGWASVDADGTARFQLKKSGKHVFRYSRDPLQPGIGSAVTADIDEDRKTPVIEIRLPETRELTGRVLDADNGSPVPGVYVSYSKRSKEESDSHGNCLAVSGEDGAFHLRVLPGQGSVRFFSQAAGYFPPIYGNQTDRRNSKLFEQTVDVPASDDVEPVILKLARGLEVRGIVRQASGKPVVRAQVRGENLDSPYAVRSAMADAEGRFTLAGLSPHVKTLITAADASGNAERNIEGAPEHPWDKTRVENIELTLGSGIRLAGRVLKDGKPVSEIRMKLSKLVPIERGARVQQLAEVETDAEGKYDIGGLRPGDGYQFEIDAPDGLMAPDWRHQSPWAPKVPADARDVFQLPDVNLISSGQSLRGVVVDPAGKPVSGITVSSKIVNGDFIGQRDPNGPTPWTESDEQGRFEIIQLPDKRIELMAYKANPKGGRIRYSSKVQPKMNQQDIRIVYDPSLDQDAEDLDKK